MQYRQQRPGGGGGGSYGAGRGGNGANGNGNGNGGGGGAGGGGGGGGGGRAGGAHDPTKRPSWRNIPRASALVQSVPGTTAAAAAKEAEGAEGGEAAGAAGAAEGSGGSEEEAKRKLGLQSRDSAALKLQAALAAAGKAAAGEVAAKATALSQLSPGTSTLMRGVGRPASSEAAAAAEPDGAPARHFSPLGAFAATTGWTSHGGSQRHMSSLLAGVGPAPRPAPRPAAPADAMMWRSINPATHTA